MSKIIHGEHSIQDGPILGPVLEDEMRSGRKSVVPCPFCLATKDFLPNKAKRTLFVDYNVGNGNRHRYWCDKCGYERTEFVEKLHKAGLDYPVIGQPKAWGYRRYGREE